MPYILNSSRKNLQIEMRKTINLKSRNVEIQKCKISNRNIYFINSGIIFRFLRNPKCKRC
jgi:hypothetical protein